jgi:4-hydroxybenzoate polyprenyltransferase
LYMFAAFSLVASAVYLVNDIIDIKQDKLHPQKSKRPFASGKVGILNSYIMAAVLMTLGLVGAFILDKNCGVVSIIYVLLNFLYMKSFKNIVIIDVLCIGAFFYLRLLIGGITIGAELSNWIVICSVLLALFLAFNKRRYDFEVSNKNGLVLEKYNQYFIDRMITVTSASVIMAYTLYTIDARTIERFGTAHLIYTVPFVLYGVLRYLFVMDSECWGGDPARILLGDYKMQLSLALWLGVSIGVIYYKL